MECARSLCPSYGGVLNSLPDCVIPAEVRHGMYGMGIKQMDKDKSQKWKG